MQVLRRPVRLAEERVHVLLLDDDSLVVRVEDVSGQRPERLEAERIRLVVGLLPVDDERVVVRRRSGLHQLRRARIDDRHRLVLAQGERKHEVLRGERLAIGPLDISPELVGGDHRAVRVNTQRAVIERRHLGKQTRDGPTRRLIRGEQGLGVDLYVPEPAPGQCRAGSDREGVEDGAEAEVQDLGAAARLALWRLATRRPRRGRLRARRREQDYEKNDQNATERRRTVKHRSPPEPDQLRDSCHLLRRTLHTPLPPQHTTAVDRKP